MEWVWDLLMIIHLAGLFIGVGSATVKLVLLLKCRTDYEFIPVYIKTAKPITGLLVGGLMIMTVSGITWLILGYYPTPMLIVKMVLVGFLWVLGPIIDNKIEPKFFKLAPIPGEAVSLEFTQILNKYLAIEITADALFYIIVIMGVLL